MERGGNGRGRGGERGGEREREGRIYKGKVNWVNRRKDRSHCARRFFKQNARQAGS